jgi:CPA2 family monovalent cation:H+ antiporter-2
MAIGEEDLLSDFSILLIAAAIIVLLFHRLRLPTVLGYILAGILIGPYVPYLPTIQNLDVIDAIAELAIIVIMFTLGLTFSLSKLRKTGLVASVNGTLVIVSMVGIGFATGLAFGWSEVNSFFLGSMIAISSTAVITKGILDRKAQKERSSQIVTGMLIVEDLAVVVILTMITGISATGELKMQGLLMTIIDIALFVMLFIAFGSLVAPRLAEYAHRTGSRELVLMTALGLCFGFSLLALFLGFSPAIGAFVAGAVLGEFPKREGLLDEIRPIKDMFSAMFFVSIGMLFDPRAVLDYWLPITVVTIVFLLAKPTLSALGTFLFGNSARTALKVGLTMMVLGEFSFIIARQGTIEGVTGDFLFPTIVTVSLVTIVVGSLVNARQEAAIGSIARVTPASLKRYTAFITLTITELRSPTGGRGRISERTRETVREIMLEGLVIVATTILLRLGLTYSGQILDALDLRAELEGTFELVLLVAALVVSLTAFYALMRRVFMLVRAASTPLISGDGKRRALKETIAYQSLRALVTLVALVGGTMVVFIVVIPHAPWGLFVLSLVMVALVIVYVLNRSVESFNERFKRVFRGDPIASDEDVTGPAVPSPERDLPVSELLSDADDLCTIDVEPGSPISGTTLGTGDDIGRKCTKVIAIKREGQFLIDPDEDEVVRPEDVLIVLERHEGSKSLTPEDGDDNGP